MRAAPPVSVRCSGGWSWRLLQTLLYTGAAAALAVWSLQQLEQPVAWAGAAVLPVAVCVWRLGRPRLATLVWDGQQWTADGVPGQLEVAIDIGSALLLKLRPAGAGPLRWLPVTRAEAGRAWQGLRVAAYARVPMAGLAGDR